MTPSHSRRRRSPLSAGCASPGPAARPPGRGTPPPPGRSPTRSASAATRGSAAPSACRHLRGPAGDAAASLLAGASFLALVGVGALAFVRPWGLRLPRWLVIVPALIGSAYAIAHALTAYVTKPLHALGVIELEFHGWAQLDEGALFLLGPALLRAVVPRPRRARHARRAAPLPPHRRYRARGAAAAVGHRRDDPRHHGLRLRPAGGTAAVTRAARSVAPRC